MGSQIKLFPLYSHLWGAGKSEGMGEPWKSAALPSLGGSLAVPMLKQEWRTSWGPLPLVMPWGPHWQCQHAPYNTMVESTAVLCSWAWGHKGCPASLCRDRSTLQNAQALFSLSYGSTIVQTVSIKGLNTSKSCQQHLTSLSNPQQHSGLRAREKTSVPRIIKSVLHVVWDGLVNAL